MALADYMVSEPLFSTQMPTQHHHRVRTDVVAPSDDEQQGVGSPGLGLKRSQFLLWWVEEQAELSWSQHTHSLHTQDKRRHLVALPRLV